MSQAILLSKVTAAKSETLNSLGTLTGGKSAKKKRVGETGAGAEGQHQIYLILVYATLVLTYRCA